MKQYCVISHTHWDREWYQTQEEFRMRLVDLIDHLLDILEKEPDYIFHMDAQTVVFEDYWEIRPERKELCCRYIKEGRILAGPWYVQNDFFLTSGEATVRNLLIGTKQAKEMGRCAETGYTPDQFGLISQLPQILNGFGMDHCVFGRGYCDFTVNEKEEVERKRPSAEFLWKSPDGSKVLAICMSYWYNNAQRFSADIEKAYRLTRQIEQSFEGIATTPYLLLMNGVDHLEPQPDLLPILREVQKRLPENQQIVQTTLEQYAKLVRQAKPETDMPVVTGELMKGWNEALLKDTASSRMYLKVQNAELQNRLEHRLEPLYAWMDMAGMKGVYPSGHLAYLWKMLIRNHAHDSICGCSTDAVHRHMEDRFAALREMMKELQRRGMKQLAAHVQTGFDEKDYKLVVFNALEKSRTEVVEADVDIVAEDNPQGLKLLDVNGNRIPFLLLEKKQFGKSVFSAMNLPGVVDTIRYRIRFSAEQVPAFGYRVYRVVTEGEMPDCSQKTAYIQNDEYVLENAYLRVSVSAKGTISMMQKDTGRYYADILSVQDVADIGNAYVFTPASGDIPVEITKEQPQIIIEESDAFAGRIRLHYTCILPKEYDGNMKCRSLQTVEMPLDIILSLTQEKKSLDIRFVLDNRAKDHRISAWIRTGICQNMAVSTAPYDVIFRNKWEIDRRICDETEHTSGMTAICSEKEGMAVLTRGIYAYEHLQDESGVLAFPLVRATGVISAGVKSDDDAWKIPENQCLRQMEYEISIMPLYGTQMTETAVLEAKAFQNPLMVQCEPADRRKFMGGRAAVQDTEIAEFFYQDLEYADVSLKQEACGFKLQGEGISVTAFKKSEDGTGYILRFYNEKDTKVQTVLCFDELQPEKVWKTNLAENDRTELLVHDRQVTVETKPKEIVTLFFMTEFLPDPAYTLDMEAL